MKKILNILVLISIIFTNFLPISNIKADTTTYNVVSIKNDGSIRELGSYSNYDEALKKLKSYNSNVDDTAVIRKNGKNIYTAYGLFRPYTSNSTVKIYTSPTGTVRAGYISPSYDSDTLFLDYDSSTNMVKIMISGLVGWISADMGDVYPISYLTDNNNNNITNNYDSNKKYVKIIYPNGLRLREGAGTTYNQVGCNGANTCSISQGGIWTTGGAIYEWIDGTIVNTEKYDWYKVNINGNIGFIANEIGTNDVIEFNPSVGSKQEFNTYYYVNSSGNLLHKYYATVTSSKIGLINLGKAPLYLKTGINYYSFDGNYFYDDFTKLVNDLRDGNHNNSVNRLPYYNYYQYLPTRTQTHYNAENLNAYIGYSSKIDRSLYYKLVYNEEAKKYKWTAYGNWDSFPSNQSMLYGEGSSFIESQEKYGVNASQTLALAINESNWGRSYMAVREYNIFGHGAFDSAPDEYSASYESIAAGIMTHAFKYIAKDYANPLSGYNYNGSHYGNKQSGNNVSYASDAYWGEKMASNYYSLDKYFDFQDFNQRLVFGIKQNNSLAPVYSDPTTKSILYYNLKELSNIPVTILDTVTGEEINGNNIWYKIQSDLPIDENRKIIDVNLGSYNFDTSYAYIHSSYIYKESKEPIISATNIKINAGVDYNPLENVTAYDAWDGDVTNKLKIVSNNVNTKIPGTYDVIYEVTDSEGNKASKTISVEVLSSKPVIEASDKNIILGNNFNPLDGVKAFDFEDGEITEKIVVKENNVDINTLGSYKVTYSVIDSNNNETIKTINVNVIEPDYKEVENVFYYDSIKEINNRIHIKGFITLKGIDNSLNNNIRYRLLFVNETTGEEIYQNLNRITNKDDMPFKIDGEDNLDYTYSWFDGDIDIELLKNGNYTMYLIANDNKNITQVAVSNVFGAPMISTYTLNNKSVLFRNNYESREAPIQLFVRDNLIEKKTSNAKYNINNEYNTIKFVDNKLVIRGVSHIIGGNYSNSVEVKRKMVFENVDTLKQYTFDIGSITTGDYVVELRASDGFDKTKAWFETNIDISSLENGTYVIYIATSSNISDYGELQDIFSRKIDTNLTYNGKKYSFEVVRDKRFRIELHVEDA